MVGFTAKPDNEAAATMKTTIGANSYKITISQDEERKKNWFDLYEIFENWTLIFFS